MQNEISELRDQVRTLKRMILGLLGLVVAGGLLAATSLQNVPDVIQAKRFEVVNSANGVAISLASDKEGGLLQINNEQGARIASLKSQGTGSTLTLIDRTLKIKTTLSADKELGGGLMLWSDCSLKAGDLNDGVPTANITIDATDPTATGAASMALFSSSDPMTASWVQIGQDGQDKNFFGFEAVSKDGNVVTQVGIENGTRGVLKTPNPKKP